MEVSPIQVHSLLTAEVEFMFTFYNTITVNGRVKLFCNMKIINVEGYNFSYHLFYCINLSQNDLNSQNDIFQISISASFAYSLYL